MRDLILRNFWLKLFSITLATVIWMLIHYSIHDESNSLTPAYIRVPITTKFAEGETRSFSFSPEEVVVTVVGRDPALFQPSQKEVRVVLDLTTFTNLQPTTLRLRAECPRDVIVLQMVPSVVEVQQISR